MSVKVMAEIWEAGPDNTAERFVLLAVADHANDDGLAYPSAARIALKTCMAERSVRRIVHRLVGTGWLTIIKNAGKNGTNLFQVHVPPLTQGHPDPGSPLTQGPQPLTQGPPPPDPGSAEPSENHQKPSGGTQLALVPPEPPPEKPRKLTRAAQIGNWRPNDHQRFDAAVQLYGSASPENMDKVSGVVDAFVDHALDKGRVSKDWSAAWRNWVTKEAEFAAARKKR